MLLFALLVLLLSHVACGGPIVSAVRELDEGTFNALINDAERDALIIVVLDGPSRSRADELLDALYTRLGDSSGITLAVWDSSKGGRGSLPPGVLLHTHSHDGEGDEEDVALMEVLLFPAGGREPTRYAFAHDPLCAPIPVPGEDKVEHVHADAPTVAGMQRWLRGVTTFPSDVPTLTCVGGWCGGGGAQLLGGCSGSCLHCRCFTRHPTPMQPRGDLGRERGGAVSGRRWGPGGPPPDARGNQDCPRDDQSCSRCGTRRERSTHAALWGS